MVFKATLTNPLYRGGCYWVNSLVKIYEYRLLHDIFYIGRSIIPRLPYQIESFIKQY